VIPVIPGYCRSAAAGSAKVASAPDGWRRLVELADHLASTGSGRIARVPRLSVHGIHKTCAWLLAALDVPPGRGKDSSKCGGLHGLTARKDYSMGSPHKT
jgi:hypothetical protein